MWMFLVYVAAVVDVESGDRSVVFTVELHEYFWKIFEFSQKGVSYYFEVFTTFVKLLSAAVFLICVQFSLVLSCKK